VSPNSSNYLSPHRWCAVGLAIQFLREELGISEAALEAPAAPTSPVAGGLTVDVAVPWEAAPRLLAALDLDPRQAAVLLASGAAQRAASGKGVVRPPRQLAAPPLPRQRRVASPAALAQSLSSCRC
jgi:hypothetical protein